MRFFKVHIDFLIVTVFVFRARPPELAQISHQAYRRITMLLAATQETTTAVSERPKTLSTTQCQPSVARAIGTALAVAAVSMVY